MGYRGGRLVDIWREEPIREASRRIRDRVGEQLLNRVVFHTPVAKQPPEVDLGGWVRERRGRQPGELKRSWKIGDAELESGGDVYRIPVYTDDPIAPYVEFDTSPHIIRPIDPSGVLRFRNREGEVVYAKIVHHPGTAGQHMMATALTEVAASWEAIGREEVDRMARTYFT